MVPVGEGGVALLYVKYAPAIYTHCHRFLHSGAAARDATQESFARVVAHGTLPAHEWDALRYLFRVSTNVCLNLLREHAVQRRANSELSARAAGGRDSESTVADREFALTLLARCGEAGARVAIMHYLDGLTQIEIAAVLGVTRKTVFNRLRKAARIAEELLRSPVPPEPGGVPAGTAAADGSARDGRRTLR